MILTPNFFFCKYNLFARFLLSLFFLFTLRKKGWLRHFVGVCVCLHDFMVMWLHLMLIRKMPVPCNASIRHMLQLKSIVHPSIQVEPSQMNRMTLKSAKLFVILREITFSIVPESNLFKH